MGFNDPKIMGAKVYKQKNEKENWRSELQKELSMPARSLAHANGEH